MASMTEDLIAYTIAGSDVKALIANQMHELHIPMPTRGPYVYAILDSSDDLRALDASVGDEPLQYLFTVECWATSPRESEDVASAIRNRINNYRGTMGTHTVQGVFVNSQSDDYQPRGAGSDRGRFSRSLTVEVLL